MEHVDPGLQAQLCRWKADLCNCLWNWSRSSLTGLHKEHASCYEQRQWWEFSHAVCAVIAAS